MANDFVEIHTIVTTWIQTLRESGTLNVGSQSGRGILNQLSSVIPKVPKISQIQNDTLIISNTDLSLHYISNILLIKTFKPVNKMLCKNGLQSTLIVTIIIIFNVYYCVGRCCYQLRGRYIIGIAQQSRLVNLQPFMTTCPRYFMWKQFISYQVPISMIVYLIDCCHLQQSNF